MFISFGSYETPKDLCDFIVEFFKAPAKDKRDSPQNNPLCDDEQLLDVVEFDDEPSTVDENGNDAVLTAYRSFVETMTGDEQSSEDENTAVPAADDNNDDTEIATTTMSLNELDMTNFFETTTNDADEVFIALKELLQSDSYGSIQEARLKLMEYMDLGRLEKGLLHFDTNRKSFQQRWMSIKKIPLKDDPGSSEDDGVFIERDSLISLHCTRGDSVTPLQSITTSGMCVLINQCFLGSRMTLK